MGKVFLVGAGPGDPKLISVKGLEKLRECDALIYDRLASKDLLEQVRPDCRKIYVGKESGKHYKKQEEINDILVECANKYHYVVRLKGGDSFVFGRGGEEIEALNQYDIPYEVIPGITSAIAVPEAVGIPVTHRGVSRSFHVITGHTNSESGILEYDYKNLARCEGTLVFLMGFHNLGIIARELVRAGKDKETPVAVISEGTTKMQQVVRGTLTNIEEEVHKQEMTTPAIIVIGETVKYEYLYKTNSLKVGITATKMLRMKLEKAFSEQGMYTIPLCNMKVIPNHFGQERKKALHNLKDYQWIIFTSQNAVTLFFDEGKLENVDFRQFGNIKFATLGSGTAEKLREYGFFADFIPSQYTISVFAEEFVKIVNPDDKIMIPRAAQGSKELTEVFKRENLLFQEFVLYDVEGSLTENIKYLDQLDYLVFVSASGVTAFFKGLREKNLKLPESIKTACIGEVTKKQLLKEYGNADVVATVNDVPGLVDAIMNKNRGDE